MNKTIIAALVTGLLAAACSDSDSSSAPPTNPTPPPGTTTAPPPPPPPGNPAPPALGAQIDRMGRPAINTATNHAFDADEATKGAAKDEWNANSDPKTWSKYAGEIEKNLAILDSLDTNCGNQLFADAAKTDATRYATLGSVLADDRLWVKADATTCTTYLAVEADATGLLKNGDCGGRKPSYEVMKITYSAVAAGALQGVTDGTTPVAEKTTVAAFPYLAPAK
jgi:hypothetical protein